MRAYQGLIILVLAGAVVVQERSFTTARDFKPMMRTRLVREIPLPQGYHEGLFVKGNTILVNNGEGGDTWEIDLATGEKVAEIKPVGGFSEGIARRPDGRYWLTDWDARKLYVVRIEDGVMAAESETSLAPEHPAGVAWDGSVLYVVTWRRSPIGTKYYLLKMDGNGAVLERIRIQGIREPSQLAWDGRHLWISSWFDRRVYKIDCETFEIKGYFRSRVEKTTGIAWDGAHFWLTGTEAGLRQIKVIEGE